METAFHACAEILRRHARDEYDQRVLRKALPARDVPAFCQWLLEDRISALGDSKMYEKYVTPLENLVIQHDLERGYRSMGALAGLVLVMRSMTDDVIELSLREVARSFVATSAWLSASEQLWLAIFAQMASSSKSFEEEEKLMLLSCTQWLLISVQVDIEGRFQRLAVDNNATRAKIESDRKVCSPVLCEMYSALRQVVR